MFVTFLTWGWRTALRPHYNRSVTVRQPVALLAVQVAEGAVRRRRGRGGERERAAARGPHRAARATTHDDAGVAAGRWNGAATENPAELSPAQPSPAQPGLETSLKNS